MISHIHSATVLVSDQEKALDFYTNKLGWETALDAPMGMPTASSRSSRREPPHSLR